MKNRSHRSTSNHRLSTSAHKKSISPQKNLQKNTYFCHFKDAMYMGGIKTFQKHGKGIIIHDNGSSIISSYYNDFIHGHNVIFLQNCLMSIIYLKGKVVECMMRISRFLYLSNYNKDGQLDGKALILDFDNRTIHQFTFRKGIMTEKKQQKQYSVLNRIFDHENFQFLLGITHSKILKFEFDNNEHIVAHQNGSKLTIGFCKKGLLSGLAFTYITKIPREVGRNSSSSDKFYLQPLERGFYFNSQLTGMGEKCFKNGNYYIGDFKGDTFQGRGLLKNAVKNNWVYGSFEAGNLKQLIDYNNEGDERKCNKIIEGMHERKNTWINKSIVVEKNQFYIQQIGRILETNPTSQGIRSLEQRKYEVLKKIQDNFICESGEQSRLNSSRNISNYFIQQSPQTARRENSYEQMDNNDNFSKQFRRSPQPHQQSHAKQAQYLDYPQNRNQYFSNQNQHTSRNYREEYNSRNNTKFNEGPTTKQSSSRQKYNQLIPQQSRRRRQEGKLSMQNEDKALRHNESKVSRIHEEGYKLDSKRLIGKSRLFKYLNKEDEEEPPRFNYVAK